MAAKPGKEISSLCACGHDYEHHITDTGTCTGDSHTCRCPVFLNPDIIINELRKKYKNPGIDDIEKMTRGLSEKYRIQKKDDPRWNLLMDSITQIFISS